MTALCELAEGVEYLDQLTYANKTADLRQTSTGARHKFVAEQTASCGKQADVVEAKFRALSQHLDKVTPLGDKVSPHDRKHYVAITLTSAI